MPEEFPADIQLEPSTDGWIADVPASRGAFFGHPIRLKINTRNAAHLAVKLLSELPRLLLEAERQFTAYHAEDEPVAKSIIREPHIWIDQELFDSTAKWTLVVGSTISPDYGLHIEFDGDKCIDVWGGT
jgi:hypothetical protein